MIKNNRLHWVDSMRGLAILAMIIFHFIFDLDFLKILSVDVYSGYPLLLARFAQLTFLFLVGFSLFLSSAKYKNWPTYFKHHLKRGLLLMLMALCITLATFFFIPDYYIRFGVLHFISIAIIITALVIQSSTFLVSGIFISLILGNIFSQLEPTHNWLFALGISNDQFLTLDYFPLFPWLSIVLFGAFMAKVFNKLKWTQKLNFIKLPPFEQMGKRSLLIYVIHQPILLLILYIYKYFAI